MNDPTPGQADTAYRPLYRELLDLLAAFPDSSGFSRAQRERWNKPLKKWMLADAHSTGVKGEVLRLLAADGGDDRPVGDCAKNTVEKWFNPWTGNLVPNHRTLIRFGVWCGLDPCRILALVLKRDWESWIKRRYGWVDHHGFDGSPEPGASPSKAKRLRGAGVDRGLADLAEQLDPAEAAAFEQALPELLDVATLDDYARRLAGDLAGTGRHGYADAAYVAATCLRLLRDRAWLGTLAGDALAASCDGVLAVRREAVLESVARVLDQYGRFEAAIERYRSFLEHHETHLLGIITRQRRLDLVEAFLAALRALCRSARVPIDAADLRRLCRRLRREQAERETAEAVFGPGSGGPIAQILGLPQLRVPVVLYSGDTALRRRLLHLLHPDRVHGLVDLDTDARDALWLRLNRVFADCKAMIDEGDLAGVLSYARACELDLGLVLSGEREISAALDALSEIESPGFWDQRIAEVEAHYEAQTIPLPGGGSTDVKTLVDSLDALDGRWRGEHRPSLELAADQCEAGMTPAARDLLGRLCTLLDDPQQAGLDELCADARAGGVGADAAVET